ncbi:MAG: hypothetical protein LBQ83_06790 [Candidatus Margulisbacteria bacterium]|jgi:hypothetical protein|nr:hypothetical protein [Candidatus Margulisiibacteriota bacterium]
MVKIIPYASAYLASYQDFARRNWGKNCYQQSEKYLDWLYRANPYKDPDRPFLIAVQEQTVVGALHKMRLPWLIDGQKTTVSAIHNLLVDPQYRQGSGLLLITASFQNESQVLCPGVLPPLSEAYKMLRCQEIDALWFRKIIAPVGAVAEKICKLPLPPREKRKTSARLIDTPGTAQIETMAAKLNQGAGNHILWDAEIFQWRFLQGPRHIFLVEDADNFLILSVGRRKGLTVARIIDGRVENEHSPLWTDALIAARSRGAAVLLAYSAETRLKKYLTAHTKPLKKHPLVFFQHRDRRAREMSFNGSAGDFGFEGLLTRRFS